MMKLDLGELRQRTASRRASECVVSSDDVQLRARDAYGETEYWEKRYDVDNTTFDWLCEWPAVPSFGRLFF